MTNLEWIIAKPCENNGECVPDAGYNYQHYCMPCLARFNTEQVEGRKGVTLIPPTKLVAEIARLRRQFLEEHEAHMEVEASYAEDMSRVNQQLAREQDENKRLMTVIKHSQDTGNPVSFIEAVGKGPLGLD